MFTIRMNIVSQIQKQLITELVNLELDFEYSTGNLGLTLYNVKSFYREIDNDSFNIITNGKKIIIHPNNITEFVIS